MMHHRRAFRTSRPRGDLRGFTLLEILVALAIFSFVLTALYGILTSTLRIRSRIEDTGGAFVIGPRILDLIEDDVRGIYFTDLEDHAYYLGENQTAGGREADRIQMVTTTDSRVLLGKEDGDRRASDVTEIGYDFRENPELDGYLEMYRREDFFVDEEPFEGGRYRRIYDRVRDFDVVYLTEGVDEEDAAGPSGAAGGGEKSDKGTKKDKGKKADRIVEEDDWDSRQENHLPRAMRIALTIGLPDPHTGEEVLYEFERIVSFPPDSGIDMSDLPSLAEAGSDAETEAATGQGGAAGRGGARGGRGGRPGRSPRGRGGAAGIFGGKGSSRGGGGRGGRSGTGGKSGRSPF